MDTARIVADESAAAARRRLEAEARLIARARAAAASGRTVPEADVDAWIDSLGTDHEMPPPRSGR